VKWAYCVIYSRSYEGKIEKEIRLVVIADLFNHDHHANTGWKRREEGWVWSTKTEIPKGTDIEISYGAAHESTSLLYDYGFIPESHEKTYLKFPRPTIVSTSVVKLLLSKAKGTGLLIHFFGTNFC